MPRWSGAQLVRWTAGTGMQAHFQQFSGKTNGRAFNPQKKTLSRKGSCPDLHLLQAAGVGNGRSPSSGGLHTIPSFESLKVSSTLHYYSSL